MVANAAAQVRIARVMGERLASGNVAVALLANTLATGAALVALILTFGPISGAHFNPAVTLADASQGGLPWRDVPGYVGAQVIGAFAGVAAAHAMFELPLFFASRHALRARPGEALPCLIAVPSRAPAPDDRPRIPTTTFSAAYATTIQSHGRRRVSEASRVSEGRRPGQGPTGPGQGAAA